MFVHLASCLSFKSSLDYSWVSGARVLELDPEDAKAAGLSYPAVFVVERIPIAENNKYSETKFSGNLTACLNTGHKEMEQALEAFIHYCYHYTDQRFVPVDLQGTVSI